MEITSDLERNIASITKRVYPFTDKEKNCINELGKMYVNRGHLKKAIIETITKYDSQREEKILDSTTEQETPDSNSVH